MQTLSITFTGKPIPFGKGQFPPSGIQKLITDIKKAIEKGKNFLNKLKEDFVNPVKNALNQAKAKLDQLLNDNFKGLKEALPGLFGDVREGVVTARNKLLDLLGNAQSVADQKFLGMKIGDLATLGATLYEAHNAFENHTNEISGASLDGVSFTLERMYGTPTIGAGVTVYNGDTVIEPDLTASTYPIVNIGDVVIVNSETRRVTGKLFETHPTGTVSIDTGTDAKKLTSSSLVYLNLANVLLKTDGGGIVKLAPQMYVKVNSEIRQINTINSMGDYLTVYNNFKYSATDVALGKEVGSNANLAFTSTINSTVKIKIEQCANSLCLDTIITGNSTNFTANLAIGDKIFYDNKEYFVVNLTNTTIETDDVLRQANNQVIFKVIEETPLEQLKESNDPEAILGLFSSVDQLTGSMGSNITGDLTTKYKAANGAYYAVSASSPKDLTKSLTAGDQINAKISRLMQNLVDRLQDDAIRELTESDLVQEINFIKQEVEDLKNEINDQIKQDLAAIKAVKGLLTGLLKLFIISCSKKKKKDGNTSSDEFLEMILMPNPIRQGCDAIESDFISILDEIDAEHNTPDIVFPEVTVPTQFEDPELLLPDEIESPVYGEEPVEDPGPVADIIVDEEPIVPPPEPDPCAQPC